MPAKKRHKTWVEISKKALVHNARLFRNHIGKDVALLATIKANAYGHGLTETAKILRPHVDRFGVDNLDEMKAVRKAGVRTPMLILGFNPSWRMAEAARLGASITVGSLQQLKWAKKGADKAGRKLKVHLKVETGTTRQGMHLKELPDAAKILKSAKRLYLEGVSTHYADIEDTQDHAYAAGQLEAYEQALKLLDAHGLRPEIRHTSNSAAAMLYPETYFGMVRVGIALYGIWPSDETRMAVVERGLHFPIEPALAWKTRIAQIKDVKRGTPISYGRTEKMPKNGRIAVLGAGYWDGIDRKLSSVGEVLVRGKRCKIMGRVCMNMTMIDVTDVPDVKAEDEVILIGASGNARITAEEAGEKIGTIGYEIADRINPLLPRIIVK